MTTSSRPTFRQRFLEKTGAAPEAYTRLVLHRTLPLHARLLLPVILLFDADVLDADHDLIGQISLLTSRREFSDYASERHYHPANKGFARKVLGFRVSVSKLQELVYDVMRPLDGKTSAAPFSAPADEARLTDAGS